MALLSIVLILTALAAPVGDAIATGDCQAVLELVRDEEPSPADKLARGWCQLQLGNHKGVIATFGTEHPKDVLGDYSRAVLAEALLGDGQPKRALEALNGLSLPGQMGLRVRLLRARGQLELERSLDAREDLRALLDTEAGVEARYWLAVGGQQRGAIGPAIATYERTWAEGVMGPWGELAAERLAALDAPVPAVDTKRQRALVTDRIAALEGVSKFEEALDLYLLLRDVSPHTTAQRRFNARQYEAAAADYAVLLGKPTEASGSADDLVRYALSLIRSGKGHDHALAIYHRIGALYPDSTAADNAAYKLGYLEYDRGNCKEAAQHFGAFAKGFPTSPHLDEALWFVGRCAYKNGQYDDALTAWERLVRLRPQSSLVPAAAYWTARTHGLQGDSEAEATELAEVLKKWPTSGYAWFAAERTGAQYEVHAMAPTLPWPELLATNPAVLRSEALFDAGFRSWAAIELAPVRGAVTGREAALAAAWKFIAVGEYRVGRSLAAPYCAKPWEQGDLVAQQACTPRPEQAIVAQVTTKYNLEPLLPFAIMNAESGLDPSVTSLAGARGLMQLMPKEAPRIHEQLYGNNYFNADNLYQGPYNASLGTAELGLKQEELGDILAVSSLPAVIASYNAGIEPVQRWLAAYDEPPQFDDFTEDIGYTETRRYVKRVLGFLMEYRMVYGDI